MKKTRDDDAYWLQKVKTHRRCYRRMDSFGVRRRTLLKLAMAERVEERARLTPTEMQCYLSLLPRWKRILFQIMSVAVEIALGGATVIGGRGRTSRSLGIKR